MSPRTPLELPALFVDTASPVVTCGLQTAPTSGAIVWEETREESGVGLFRLVEEITCRSRCPIAGVRTIVFCEGPGSLLGIRLAAMALRTWTALAGEQPPVVLAYRSLDLVAAHIVDGGTAAPFSLITDARRNTWNLLHVTDDRTPGEMRRWPAGEPFPSDGPVFHLAAFPHWQPLPASARPVQYCPRELPRLAAARPQLLRPVADPDAFLVETPTYRTWTGGVATAPAAPQPR